MNVLPTIKSVVSDMVANSSSQAYADQSNAAVTAFLEGLQQGEGTITMSALLTLLMQSISTSIDRRIEGARVKLDFLELTAGIESWIGHAFANQGKGLSIKDAETQKFLAIGGMLTSLSMITPDGLCANNIFDAKALSEFTDAWTTAKDAIDALKQGAELSPEQLSLLRTAAEKMIRSMTSLYRTAGDPGSGTIKLDKDMIASEVTRLQSERSRINQDYRQLGTTVTR